MATLSALMRTREVTVGAGTGTGVDEEVVVEEVVDCVLTPL
jgi:hypothetical protein